MPIIKSFKAPYGNVDSHLIAGPITLATKYVTNGVTIDLKGTTFQISSLSSVVLSAMNMSGYLPKLVSISGGAFKMSLFKFTATTSGVYEEEANDADISGETVGHFWGLGLP